MAKESLKNVVSKASVTKVSIPVSKMKLTLDQVRGKKINNALGILKNTRRRANSYIIDLLNSAVANAIQKDSKLKAADLRIGTIKANQGQSLKRMMPRAFGRGSIITKKSCQVYVELEGPINNN